MVPKHVSREDFFDVFEGMLKETEGVSEVSVGNNDRIIIGIVLKMLSHRRAFPKPMFRLLR